MISKKKRKEKRHLYIKYMVQLWYSLFYRVEKKIFFTSMKGTQYSCNPRAICEKMHELYPDYDLVFGIVNGIDCSYIPDYVRIQKKGGLRYYKELTTSFAVVRNENFEKPTYKRKKQFFVQTWHGDRGFKKVLYEAAKDGKKAIEIADNDVTDIAVAGSKYGERKYREAFRYNGKIISKGSPRNDRLVNGISKEEKRIICERIGVREDVKMLLYAPTFRSGKDRVQKVDVDLKQVLEALGEDWVCLLRAHSWSGGLQFGGDERLYDVSKYPDMADLLCVSNFLITDYSSSCGDFVLTKKPIVLALFDKDEYESTQRGFVAEPEETGFIIANNNEELLDIIKNTSIEGFSESANKVINYYGIFESGKASEEVCHMINDEWNCYNNHKTFS